MHACLYCICIAYLYVYVTPQFVSLFKLHEAITDAKCTKMHYAQLEWRKSSPQRSLHANVRSKTT